MANKVIGDYDAIVTPDRTDLLLVQPSAGGLYKTYTPADVLGLLEASDLTIDEAKVSKLYTPSEVEAASVDSSGDTTFEGGIQATEYTFYESNNFKEYIFVGTTYSFSVTYDIITIDLSASGSTFLGYLEMYALRSGNSGGGKTGRYGVYVYAENSYGTTTFSVDTVEELNNPESSSFSFSLAWSGTDDAKALQLTASSTYMKFFCKVLVVARGTGTTVF